MIYLEAKVSIQGVTKDLFVREGDEADARGPDLGHPRTFPLAAVNGAQPHRMHDDFVPKAFARLDAGGVRDLDPSNTILDTQTDNHPTVCTTCLIASHGG